MNIETFINENKADIYSYLKDLVESLQDDIKASPDDYKEFEDDEPMIDIRLAIDLNSPYRAQGWAFWTGLSDYDSYHSEYCAASSVGLDTNAEELIEDLLGQLEY